MKLGVTISKEITRDNGYVHVADSNRHAPGWGHIYFKDVFKGLKSGNYDGWICVCAMPVPDADSAAIQSVKYLEPLLTL